MLVRLAQEADWPEIKRLHAATGYGYELPERATFDPLYVCVEDGNILAAAGMQKAAQIVAVVDISIKAPHRRMAALNMFYPAMARDAIALGCETVFAFCDPLYRHWDRRMMKMGWNKKLWPCMFLDKDEIRKAFGAEK